MIFDGKSFPKQNSAGKSSDPANWGGCSLAKEIPTTITVAKSITLVP
jgi:hypothetical protein